MTLRSKHLLEQSRKDPLGQIIRLAALAAEGVGLVEDLDDAVLLGKGREGDLEVLDECLTDVGLRPSRALIEQKLCDRCQVEIEKFGIADFSIGDDVANGLIGGSINPEERTLSDRGTIESDQNCTLGTTFAELEARASGVIFSSVSRISYCRNSPDFTQGIVPFS